MNKNKSVLASAFGNQKRWINWQYEKDDNGKETKVPYQKNLTYKASTTNASTWSTHEDVLKISSNIGIVFTSTQMLLGIDFDHCLRNGKIVHSDHATIERFLAEMNTYVEISPSGNGLHAYLVLTAPLDLISNKKAPYELYTSGRFFTVTNNQYSDFGELRTVTPRQALELLSIIGYPWKRVEKPKNQKSPVATPLNDEVVLFKMFASKTGNKIRSLYNGDISSYDGDDSSADLALCSYLAFWTAKDALQIERMWLASPLGQRQKTQERKDYRDLTIQTAITGCKEVYSQSQYTDDAMASSAEKSSSQADQLLKIIDTRDDIVLFHDERGTPYIALNIEGHQEVWPCKGKDMKNWLVHELWKKQKKGSGSEALKAALAVIEGRARFEGKRYCLSNRMAWKDGELWYDLTNEKWQAVKINKDGWSIVDNPPILFKRYQHNKQQALPNSNNGNVNLILNYVNIANERHRLLVLVFMISCFISDFPHAILVIYGPQGSSKTTFARLMRFIIDPSLLDVISLPYGYKEIVQLLDHNAFSFFDNVSAISPEVSDILCKAVTGSGFSKRELYTDDDDIIYNFKRCIAINGINIVATRPDLLERSLLIELERIDPENRKEESEMMEKFKEDLPLILAGVFNTLAKAMEIKSTIKLTSSPRMADFTKWGCAIAQALGYSQEDFLSAYKENIDQQSELVINENIVARAVIAFMQDKTEWSGTATELLRAIDALGFLEGVDSYEQYWPKSSNAFTRKLNELKINLKEVGILYETSKGVDRIITLKKA